MEIPKTHTIEVLRIDLTVEERLIYRYVTLFSLLRFHTFLNFLVDLHEYHSPAQALPLTKMTTDV